MTITHQSPKITRYTGEPFDPVELEPGEARSKEQEVMGKTGRVISREEAATYAAILGSEGWFSSPKMIDEVFEATKVNVAPSSMRHTLLKLTETGVLERFDKVMPHQFRYNSEDGDLRTAAEIYGFIDAEVD